MLGVERLHGLVEVHAALGVPSGHLAGEHTGHDGVLVACVQAHEVAIALLEAHEEAVALASLDELVHLAADVLEAGEHATNLKAIVLGQGVGHGGGDDGGHDDLAAGVLAGLGLHAGQPVDEQDTHLVAGEQLVVALVRNGHAHAVGVGVGGEHEVGVDLVAQLEALLERLAELGVGVRAGREVPVGLGLLGNHGDVGDAHALEDLAHALDARAVERGVDHREVGVGLGADGLGGHRVDEAVKHGVVNPLDQAGLEGLVEDHVLHAGEDVGLVNGVLNLVGGLVGDLAAVLAVDLVAVVGRRVVAGGDADACGALEVARSEGQRRHRLDTRVDERLHAVGGQHAGRGLHELLALVARVARDGDGGVLVVGVEVGGEALAGLRHRVDVHAVGADAKGAAQAGRTKGEAAVEGVRELLGVGVGHKFVELSGQIGLGEVFLPELGRSSNLLVHVLPFIAMPTRSGEHPIVSSSSVARRT